MKGRGPLPLVTTGLAVACAAVTYVEIFVMGHASVGLLLFAAWNCTPMLVALGMAAVARTRGPGLRQASYGFAAGATGVVLLAHAGWLYDVGKIASGSSTSALVFVFLPFHACLCGLALAVPIALIGHLAHGYRSPPQ